MDPVVAKIVEYAVQGVVALGVAYVGYLVDRNRRDNRKDREQAAKLQAAQQIIDEQRHAVVVDRLDRIDRGQSEMRDEIRALHEEDRRLAVEIERRASRIEGHLGMHIETGARRHGKADGGPGRG